MTKEEIEKRIELLENELDILDSLQYAVKIIINQFYGAFGNKYFYFHNNDIAESITLQGQDLIQFSIKVCNHYFMNLWHTDKSLHDKLGISDRNVSKIETECVIYVDTDSNYVMFKPIIMSVDGLRLTKKESIQFVIDIIKHRFGSYLSDAFDNYAKAYNTNNRMVFKLENISDCGIWVAKKMYVYREYYGPEKGYIDDKKIKPKAKGLPCTKPSHPKYAREIIWDIINVLLDVNNGIVHERHIVPKLKSYYEKFCNKPMDDISYNYYVNNFSKNALPKSEYTLVDYQFTKKMGKAAVNTSSGEYHIVETKKKGSRVAEITEEFGNYYLVEGCTSNVRGCASFNNIVIDNNITMLPKVKSGDKIKMYYVNNDVSNKTDSFCYLPGKFDSAVSVNVDYKMHFFKSVITPVNSLLEAIGKQTLDINMKREFKFKQPKVPRGGTPYPFFCVNTETLESYEIPEKFMKYLLTDKDIPEYLWDEYDAIISKYTDDLIILSHVDIEKYMIRRRADINKRFNKDMLKSLNETQVRLYTDAIQALKKQFKFKITYDDNTKETVVYKSRDTRRFNLTMDMIKNMKCVENYISAVFDFFDDADDDSE
jgi:DNA polymerase elongation subunit (family B)